jgi:hypothetical protein
MDSDEEQVAAGRHSPAECFMQTLELCEVVGKLASATVSQQPASDLEAKARLYVRPLRAVMHS